MLRKSLLFSVFFILFFATQGFSANKSKKVNPGIDSIENMKPNGNYVISILKDGKWTEVGNLSFDKYYRERTISLSSFLMDIEEPEINIKITKSGGGAAHIDLVALDGNPPSDVNSTESDIKMKKLSFRDYDVIDGIENGEHIVFNNSNIKRGNLTLVARIEAPQVSKEAFKFPLDNNLRNITPGTKFYSYELGQNEWSVKIDGDLREIKGQKPFFKEFTEPVSGHTSGYTYVWVGNDREYLYAAIDFTSDRTMDGDMDYAGIYVNTSGGIKEFRVSMKDTQWGKPGFIYTDNADYPHKVYELKIPLKKIGLDSKSRQKVAKLAVSAYGEDTSGGN